MNRFGSRKRRDVDWSFCVGGYNSVEADTVACLLGLFISLNQLGRDLIGLVLGFWGAR